MDITTWGQVAAAFAGGGGLMKAADLVFSRKSREITALNGTIDGLSHQLERADGRLDGFERRLDECHAQHQECRGELLEVKLRQAEIEALMKGRIAGMSEKAPK